MSPTTPSRSEALRSDLPVLVDFRAPWCGPCHQLAPVLAAIAEEHPGSRRVVKLDVDEDPVMAARYRVTGPPTMKVYRDGDVARSIVGARPELALSRELEESIGS